VPVFWAVHRQSNADRVRHRVFPEPAENIAAVRCTKAIGDRSMGNIIIELGKKEVMRLEGILLDADQADALSFLKEVIKPKLRARQVAALDRGKSTGIMT